MGAGEHLALAGQESRADDATVSVVDANDG
jgi:hypothetical protein